VATSCAILWVSIGLLGCRDDGDDPPPAKVSKSSSLDSTPHPAADAKKIAPGVYLERRGTGKAEHRRVLVDARVCLREGGYGLETLLCRSQTKEHESILATDADAKLIHAALLAAGAEPGHPVRFFENKPPQTATGTRIVVSLSYKDKNGKQFTIPAREWILNVKTKKPLDQDWVFAGSILYKDPDEPKQPARYVANEDGAYICVNNVPTAMLDLPITSENNPEARIFQFNTPKIPPIGTKVTVVLDPRNK